MRNICRVWLCTLSVLSRECARVRGSSLPFKYNMYIFVCVYIYTLIRQWRETTRLWLKLTFLFFFFSCCSFFLLCLAPVSLSSSHKTLRHTYTLTHIRKIHTQRISMLYTDMYNGIQLMRINDRAREQMRRRGWG